MRARQESGREKLVEGFSESLGRHRTKLMRWSAVFEAAVTTTRGIEVKRRVVVDGCRHGEVQENATGHPRETDYVESLMNELPPAQEWVPRRKLRGKFWNEESRDEGFFAVHMVGLWSVCKGNLSLWCLV